MTVEQWNIDALATTQKRLAAARKEVEKARCDLLDARVDEIQLDIDRVVEEIGETICVEQAVLDGDDPNDAQTRYRLRVDSFPNSRFYLRDAHATTATR